MIRSYTNVWRELKHIKGTCALRIIIILIYINNNGVSELPWQLLTGEALIILCMNSALLTSPTYPHGLNSESLAVEQYTLT